MQSLLSRAQRSDVLLSILATQTHSQTEDGNAALLLAAESGDVGAVRRLVGARRARKLSTPRPSSAASDGAHSVGTPAHAVLPSVKWRRNLRPAMRPDGAVGLNGYTPLAHACARGHVEAVKVLLQHGSSCHVCVASDDTPLHLAALTGNADVVDVLLDHGAQVDARNEYGETPLFNACSKGHAGVVKLLLQRGADPEAKDRFGDLPRDQALTPAVGAACDTQALRQGPFGTLPWICLLPVLEFLTSKDLGRVATVCSKWRRVMDAEGRSVNRIVPGRAFSFVFTLSRRCLSLSFSLSLLLPQRVTGAPGCSRSVGNVFELRSWVWCGTHGAVQATQWPQPCLQPQRRGQRRCPTNRIAWKHGVHEAAFVWVFVGCWRRVKVYKMMCGFIYRFTRNNWG